jgi:hypothetical protein
VEAHDRLGQFSLLGHGKGKEQALMANLTPSKRAKMPAKQFAGPGKSFPVNDKTHQRLAISGATRSERAGNISEDQADAIKARARALLGQNSPLKKLMG